MKVNPLKNINWKEIIFFVSGAIVLSGGLGFLIYLGLQTVDLNFLEQKVQFPLHKTIFSMFKLYIIIYILFSTLPDKIKKATWGKKAIYFTLFYIFGIAIYVVI